jgi:hypothetical protein
MDMTIPELTSRLSRILAEKESALESAAKITLSHVTYIDRKYNDSIQETAAAGTAKRAAAIAHDVYALRQVLESIGDGG